jgi:hypothetical protein
MDTKKSEEELDKLHEQTMENLYEIFEDEFDCYFRFYEAAMEVLGHGEGTFPFDTYNASAIDKIDKVLETIEDNIINHIKDQLSAIFEKRKKKYTITNRHSEKKKIELSKKIKQIIKESIAEMEE